MFKHGEMQWRVDVVSSACRRVSYGDWQCDMYKCGHVSIIKAVSGTHLNPDELEKEKIKLSLRNACCHTVKWKEIYEKFSTVSILKITYFTTILDSAFTLQLKLPSLACFCFYNNERTLNLRLIFSHLLLCIVLGHIYSLCIYIRSCYTNISSTHII